jgi:hypothetical protein
MRLDLGGQPWAAHELSETVLSRFEEPLELCSHLRIRRAELRRVALPETVTDRVGAPRRFMRGEQLKHRLLNVQTLELDHNELEEVDGDGFQFPNLEYLDLSFNRIHRIQHARLFLGRLRVLILRRNKMANLRWLYADGVRLPLSHLDVSFNMVQSISDCAEIVNLFDLETLDISNNPLEGDLTVEAFCMLGCPQLTHLNGQVVSDVARARARTWCDESDAGRAIAEYVAELHSYYAKPGRSGPENMSRSAGAAIAPRHLTKAAPAVKDPLGYLQQSAIATEYLVEAARRRKHTTTKRYNFSVMQLSVFEEDKRGGGPRLLPWKYWSTEMRRLGRRIAETRAAS